MSAADLKDGRTFRFPPSTDSAGRDQVKIKCSPEKPADAFATVRYRNQQFKVDDRDRRTKRAFMAIVFPFTMVGSTGREQMPLVTIAAQ